MQIKELVDDFMTNKASKMVFVTKDDKMDDYPMTLRELTDVEESINGGRVFLFHTRELSSMVLTTFDDNLDDNSLSCELAVFLDECISNTFIINKRKPVYDFSIIIRNSKKDIYIALDVYCS